MAILILDRVDFTASYMMETKGVITKQERSPFSKKTQQSMYTSNTNSSQHMAELTEMEGEALESTY